MHYYSIQRIIYKLCIFLVIINSVYGAETQSENLNIQILDAPKSSNQLPNNSNIEDANLSGINDHIVYRININNSTNRVLKLEFAQECHYLFQLNNKGEYLSSLTLEPGQSSGLLYSYDYKQLGCLAPSYVGRNIGISFKYDNDPYPSYIVEFHTEYHAAAANEHEVFYFIDGRNSVPGEFLADLQRVVSSRYFGNDNIRNKIAYSRVLGATSGSAIYDYNIDVLKDLVMDNDTNQTRYIKAFVSPYK